MATPAYGQASRDRMARNSKALMEHFTHEGWRASKHAGAAQRRDCAGFTAKGEPCMAPVGYGALKDSDERPSYNTPDSEMVFYCHRHATERLEGIRGY